MQTVFDGHNDVLYRLWRNASKGADPVAEFIDGTRLGHIDMPRAKAGGLAGGAVRHLHHFGPIWRSTSPTRMGTM